MASRKTQRREIRDEDIGLDTPQPRLPQAVRQPDHVGEHRRPVHFYALPGRQPGHVVGKSDGGNSRQRR
jgi:hypothetical protein